MSKKNASAALGEAPIGKLLISFSVPAIVGMIVNALYNVVDRMFVGKGVGTYALSGITIAFPIMNIIMAFGMLVGVGATALISIRLGQGRREEAERILGNTVTLSLASSIIITVLGIMFLEPILTAFGGSGEVLRHAKDYSFIILLGTIFGNLAFSVNNIIRAEGKPKIAMLTMIFGTVVNIILNPIFIFVLGLGVKGSAIATCISQAASAIWVMYYFRSKRSLLKFKIDNFKLDPILVRGIFAIGMSPFAMQLANSVITIVFNKQLSLYGDDIAIAAMGVINSIAMLILMPIFGINQGVQPIIGYNYGAKKYLRVKKALVLAIIAATSVATIGFLLVELFPQQIVMIFADKSNPEILNEFMNMGSYGLRVFLCMLPLVGFQIVSSNYFQSVGKAKYSIFLSLSRQVIILLPLLIVMPRFLGFHGVFIAGPVSDFLSSLLTAFVLIREIKKLNVENTLT